MKLLIATPYITKGDPPCKETVDALDKCGMEWDFHVRTGYGVDMQRNRIAAMSLAEGYDWLLMVDADILLPTDALANLLGLRKRFVLCLKRRRFNCWCNLLL